jgi:protein-disulfide isomerase
MKTKFKLGISTIVCVFAAACTSHPHRPTHVPSQGTNVIAIVGDQSISEDELISQDRVTFCDLERRKYDLLNASLQQLLIKILVGAQAAAHNTDLESYIRNDVARAATNITEAEFEGFLRDKNMREQEINATLRERITAYLIDQKRERMVQDYVTQLAKETPVKVYLKRPRMALRFDLPDTAPVFGNTNSPVTLVSFIDLEDPFMARTVPTLNKINEVYGSRIRIAFLHFPIPSHTNAHAAAELAMAVAERNKDAFWAFCNTALTNREHLTSDDLATYAKTAGIDAGQCLASQKYFPLVDQQRNFAETLGVRTVPTFLINGEWISGALPFETFAEAINAAFEETNPPH